MNPLVISVILVLCIIFIIICIDAVIRSKISYIISPSPESTESVEGILRDILKNNAGSEIIIIDNSSTEEAKHILKTIAKDFPQIHIVEKNKKINL